MLPELMTLSHLPIGKDDSRKLLLTLSQNWLSYSSGIVGIELVVVNSSRHARCQMSAEPFSYQA